MSEEQQRTEDERPEVEGHRLIADPASAEQAEGRSDEDETPDVEGHFKKRGPVAEKKKFS